MAQAAPSHDVTFSSGKNVGRQALPPRRGFTLIELLIVISIIVVLASLGFAAYLRSMSVARVTATQMLIETLNSALQERIDIFIQSHKDDKPSAFALIAAKLDSSPGNIPRPQTMAYNRAILIDLLSKMQREFPQQFWDIAPYTISNPELNISQTNASAGIYRDYIANMILTTNPVRRLSDLTVYAVENSSTWEAAFFPGPVAPDGSPRAAGQLHDPATESSECLYLILSQAVEGSSFSVSQIPPQYVKDTDGDGLMEFVDAWGNPLRFYRWPTDFFAYLIDITGQVPEAIAQNTLDPNGYLTENTWFAGSNRVQLFENLGYFRLHDAYYNPVPTPGVPRLLTSTPDTSVARSYPISPMIVSAGPDGKFGFLTPNSASRSTPQNRSPYPRDDLSPIEMADELSYRMARIDPLDAEYVVDNITNLNYVGARGN